MIVTIDGPAGSGKSSVATRLAERLGFRFLNTGAMYRALAHAASSRGWPTEDGEELAQRAEQLDLRVDAGRLLVDGEDTSEQLRSPEVAAYLPLIAENERIRALLNRLQQQFAFERVDFAVDLPAEARVGHRLQHLEGKH